MLLGLYWIALGMLLSACNRSPEPTALPVAGSSSTNAEHNPPPPATIRVVERSSTAMATLFTISVTSATDRELAQRASEEAFTEIRRIDVLMTTWNPTSLLSQVNASAGLHPVVVPRELLDIVERSKQISVLSSGKFNIAAETLMGLWNHKAPSPHLPDPAEVTRRVRLLDPKGIHIDREKGTLYLDQPGMRIGLGGIAKGYAVDRAAQILRAHQIRDFIVDGGGNLFVSGKNGNSPWNIGIQDPRTPSRAFARFDVMSDCGISTSGDYIKFFMLGGKRYHHILDPDTGYPAEGMASTTVVAPTAEYADALSTAMFVLGVDKGMRLIEADPSLDAIFVDDRLNTKLTPRLQPVVHLTPMTDPAVVGDGGGPSPGHPDAPRSEMGHIDH